MNRQRKTPWKWTQVGKTHVGERGTVYTTHGPLLPMAKDIHARINKPGTVMDNNVALVMGWDTVYNMWYVHYGEGYATTLPAYQQRQHDLFKCAGWHHERHLEWKEKRNEKR